MSGYQKPTSEKEWEEYREMAQAFSTWACEKLNRLEAEIESLRAELKRAQIPCGCEETIDDATEREMHEWNDVPEDER